mgnify:CR=1 FL=1
MQPGATRAPRHQLDSDCRDRLRAGRHLRLHRRQAQAPDAGRLSRGRRLCRSVHAGLRRRSRTGWPVGRTRCHPAHVRRRPSLFRLRPSCRSRSGRARRHRPDRRGDASRHGTFLPLGLDDRRGYRFRPEPFRGEHGGAAQGARTRQSRFDAHGPRRDRLAHRGRPCHGACAGAAAGLRGNARWPSDLRRWWARRRSRRTTGIAGSGRHADQGCRLHGACRRAWPEDRAGHPDARGANRVAGAFYADRARDRLGNRLRLRRGVPSRSARSSPASS